MSHTGQHQLAQCSGVLTVQQSNHFSALKERSLNLKTKWLPAIHFELILSCNSVTFLTKYLSLISQPSYVLLNENLEYEHFLDSGPCAWPPPAVMFTMSLNTSNRGSSMSCLMLTLMQQPYQMFPYFPYINTRHSHGLNWGIKHKRNGAIVYRPESSKIQQHEVVDFEWIQGTRVTQSHHSEKVHSNNRVPNFHRLYPSRGIKTFLDNIRNLQILSLWKFRMYNTMFLKPTEFWKT